MESKNQNRSIAGFAVKLAASAALMAGVVASQQALAGIANTKHNLGSTHNTGLGGSNNYVTNGTEEVCVFCHTPHGTNTAANGKAPLWNKNIQTGTYSTYASNSSPTINGEILAVGSVSIACLSCHDGSQAMDNMFNAPGSGWGTGSGTSGVSQSGWTWNGSGQSGGKLSSGNAANLGGSNNLDLTNDHPIGIEYCGGLSAAGEYTGGNSGNCRNLDFKSASTRTVANGLKQWWVDTSATVYVDSQNGGAGTYGGNASKREKTDMILFTRDDSGSQKPYVECATCHDPHVEAKSSTQVAFLRVSQSGSGVCLACHTK